MGQQHLLFLILGVCIIGIAISAGSIVLQSDPGIDCRQKIYSDLNQLSVKAQQYHRRSFEEGGGDGSFLGLTASPQGILKLTRTPSTPHGEFIIKQNGNPQCVQIIALGNAPGNDQSKPIRIQMNVFAETTSVVIIN